MKGMFGARGAARADRGMCASPPLSHPRGRIARPLDGISPHAHRGREFPVPGGEAALRNLAVIMCACVAMCACGSGGTSGGGGGAATPSVLVSISPATQTDIDQGQSVQFTATVQNDPSSSGVTWKISGAGETGSTMGTFSNVTANSATYNATTQATSPLSVTVTAASVTSPLQMVSTTVVVYPPLIITTTSLPMASPNANYVADLEATGGVGALTWSLTSGTLPAGLSLGRSGNITGVPTVVGTSSFTVQVTDSSNSPGGPDWAQAQLTLTVVPPLSISTTSLPAAAAGVTYLADLTATGGVAPYTWSLAQGSLPPGLTLQSSSGIISGTPTSQGNFTFTVAVEDESPTRQTETQSYTISVGPPTPLAIATTALLDATVGTPYVANVVATGGTPPYTWTSGTLPAGLSLSATGAISGTPSSAGATSFAITVTDSGSPPSTQVQQLNLAVENPPVACASSGNNAVLTGPYAFSLSGFNDSGFLTVLGSFTADGSGNITAGEADTNGFLGAQHGNIISAASSYSVGPDNRGCATIATPFGTFAARFILGSLSSNIAASGRIIEWDSPSSSAYIAAGQLLLQTSSAFTGGLNGSYVFRNIGWDSPPQGGRNVCVGVLNANGNSFSSLEEDCNDAWDVSYSAEPEGAGTFTPPDANGRGSGMLNVLGTSSLFAYYLVSSSQLLVVNADSGPFTSGEWDLQTLPGDGSGFGQSSLNGNMVFYLNGLGEDGTASTVSAETANANGIGSLSMTFYEDLAGTVQSPGAYTCGYDIESSGRVTLSGAAQSCGGIPPVLYLTGQNAGFILDASPGVDTGAFEPQVGDPFSNSMLVGTFFGGIDEVVLPSATVEVDAIAPSGIANITGQMDVNSTTAQDAGASFVANTWSINPDGTFTLNTSDGAVAGIIISSSRFVLFSPATFATSYPTLLIVQK